MAAAWWRNDGGTERKTKEFYHNDGGTWREAKEYWKNDNGVWRKVFDNSTSALPIILWEDQGIIDIDAVDLTGSTDTASITIHRSGISNREETGTVIGDWLDTTGSTNGDDFEIRRVHVSGDAATGSTSWTPLNADRTFSLTRSAIGLSQSVFDLEIRPIDLSAATETRRVTLRVTIE